ncbi:hypothetical protein [Galbibacter pacificus]|uniref:N-acetyltransferase domain-containing protein n=1 Tax=Galbibacter pacificus TaxID=2996052 RepID=A0ABT6FN94_9FLAO|nr:hypothetical protein [Galbibacter pacificus]MDG3581078.1 hypothetical protein [Galbibacter pacificus]MDG3584556.1 hypothetical protein [Galbibacter pacificus]
MEITSNKEGVIFSLHKKFHHNFLTPIGKYVNWKLENDWDDYNELYHSIRYIENLKKQPGICFETHTIEKNKNIIGVLLIVGGELDRMEDLSNLPENKTVLLKYFHIVDKGNGYGSYWLNEVILPYYAKKNFEYLLVSSSHPKSFNFYRKIGKEIGTSVKKSDNGIYHRTVKSFRVLLKN